MNESKDKKKTKILKKFLTRKVIVTLAVVCVLVVVILGVSNKFFQDSETVELRFENIGELATQCAYCTEVGVIEEARELFKVKIPFTQSKYIYTVDFAIKAGFNFEEIEWDVTESKIVVDMPAVKVLSNEVKTDKIKVYHEKESIFKQIKLEDVLVSIDNMKKDAEKNAISNGLYENAKENAEKIIEGFLGQQYDLQQYKIKFRYAEDNN